MGVACQGAQMSPAVAAVTGVLCLHPATPLPTALHMLGLVGLQAGRCPPGPFLGLLTALFRGPTQLVGAQAYDEAAWERHEAIGCGAAQALLGVADTGAT